MHTASQYVLFLKHKCTHMHILISSRRVTQNRLPRRHEDAAVFLSFPLKSIVTLVLYLFLLLLAFTLDLLSEDICTLFAQKM